MIIEDIGKEHESTKPSISRRVLVTGAGGFVGPYVLEALSQNGYEAIMHGRQDGDIGRSILRLDNIGHVIHLAARTFVPDSWESPREFYETNVLGTVNVLELCRRQGASLTLVSSYAYGKPQWLPIGEDHPVQAFNPYGHSKLLAEEVAQFYARHFGLHAAVVRPFNIYGPGQTDRFLIPALVKQALDPLTDTITVADLRPRRDYLHVRDLVELLLLTISKGATGVYNAGSGQSTSIPELVTLINGEISLAKALTSTNRIRPDEVLDTVADCAKAQRELGWSPKTSLKDGIREIVKGARGTGIRSGNTQG